MKAGLKIDGLEIEVNCEEVKYAVEGVWHVCSFDDFVELLARHFKPRQKRRQAIIYGIPE